MKHSNSMQVWLRPWLIPVLFIFISFGIRANPYMSHSMKFDYAQCAIETELGEDGVTYTVLKWNGMSDSGVCGEPALPSKTINFLVPSFSKGFRVSVDNMTIVDSVILENEIKTISAHSMSGAVSFVEEPVSESKFSVAKVAGHMFINPCTHIVSVTVSPFLYDDATRKLTIVDGIDIRLEYETCSKEEAGLDPDAPMTGHETLDLRGIVVNPEFQQGDKSMAAALFPSTSVSYKGYYYIVTLNQFREAFENLKVWKAQKGYSVTLVTVEDILDKPDYKVGSSSNLVDEAASVRRYLMDEYKCIMTGEKPYAPMQVLLAGDIREGFPIRKVRTSSSTNTVSNPNGDGFVPTDNYFGDLTTSWSLDWCPNQGFYTSYMYGVTQTLNVPVGRLLCRTVDDINNYIEKLLIYESMPGRGDNEYLGKMYSYFHYDGFDDRAKTEESFSWFPSYTEELEYSHDHFPLPYGLDIVPKLKNYGFQSWSTHGQPSSFRISNGKDEYFTSFISAKKSYTPAENKFTDDVDPKFSHPQCRGNLDEMDNAGKPGVIYTIACDIVSFDQYFDGKFQYNIPYNMGASYTCGKDYGGVAFLGNTRSGWYGISTDLLSCFAKTMQTHAVGRAEMQSKLDYLTIHAGLAQVYFEHSLIGEPEFTIWRDVPLKSDVIFRSGSGTVGLMGTSLLNSDVTVYNGVKVTQYLHSSATSASINLGSVCTNPQGGSDGMISVWSDQKLPVQKLIVFDTNLSNKKSYILQDVELGAKYFNGKYTVGSSGSLHLRCLNSLKSDKGLLVKNGGVVTVESDCETTLGNDIIESGGRMVIVSGKTCLNAGMTVEKGGYLEIRPNK